MAGLQYNTAGMQTPSFGGNPFNQTVSYGGAATATRNPSGGWSTNDPIFASRMPGSQYNPSGWGSGAAPTPSAGGLGSQGGTGAPSGLPAWAQNKLNHGAQWATLQGSQQPMQGGLGGSSGGTPQGQFGGGSYYPTVGQQQSSSPAFNPSLSGQTINSGNYKQFGLSPQTWGSPTGAFTPSTEYRDPSTGNRYSPGTYFSDAYNPQAVQPGRSQSDFMAQYQPGGSMANAYQNSPGMMMNKELPNNPFTNTGYASGQPTQYQSTQTQSPTGQFATNLYMPKPR